MTTPPPTRSAGCDIPAVHDAIAPVAVLQRERRALYQFAVDLMCPNTPGTLGLDVIDNPIARHHIGEALAGRARLAPSELVGISAVADVGQTTSAELRVVSRPDAATLLAAALSSVGTELIRQRAASGPPELLTTTDGEQFASALSVLGEGVALARSLSSELIDNLLPHVALVAIVDPQHAGRLASASPRSFPGLILLESPGPQSSIDVAEALVHEGAHQKFFDLAITRDLLDVDSDRCPPFHPPWAPEDRQWPLEQTLAAGHAYACLARFAHDADVPARRRPVTEHSLLPAASERCDIIGQWLLDNGDYLGPSAHTLLEGMLGRQPRTPIASADRPTTTRVDYTPSSGLTFRRCGSTDRVLAGRATSTPQLFWISEDAAVLLELLGHNALGDVVDSFAQRWCVPQFDAHARLIQLLSDLSTSGLVTANIVTAPARRCADTAFYSASRATEPKA